MSSRLALDSHGRRVVVVTASGQGLEVGQVFVVLGNLVHSTVSGDKVLFAWLGTSGRPPTPREQMEARAPYQAGRNGRRLRDALEEVPDDSLAEQAAIELARREQEREPVDLLNAA